VILAGLVAVCATVLGVAGVIDGDAVLGLLAGLVLGIPVPAPRSLRGPGGGT
jgi:hypothetical protein